MSDQIVIKVNHVSKDFILPHEKVDSVKSLFTSIMTKRNKGAERQHALKDISFEVNEGEFFGIVGRNGSGKSTLLKILAGIYQPTQGDVMTRGKLVPFIELGVGFNPELTGRENVFLNGAMLGFTRKQIAAMYDDIVSFAEIERFMDQKLKNYSSGMQVRLAFSMATRSEADILLIDEVLAVGDADFQRKCFDYFKQLKKNGKTVIFVSHDMSAVTEYCDRAILIEESKVIRRGSAHDVATEYTKMFIESADQSDSNLVKGKRYGNMLAKILEVTVSPRKIVAKTDPLVITASIQSQTALNNVIIGFAIKSGDGHTFMGSNTKTDRLDTGEWQAQQTKTISWSIPNIFSDGKYYVDVAVLQSDGLTVCDWIEDAMTFKSFDTRHVPYAINPDVKTVLKEVS